MNVSLKKRRLHRAKKNIPSFQIDDQIAMFFLVLTSRDYFKISFDMQRFLLFRHVSVPDKFLLFEQNTIPFVNDPNSSFLLPSTFERNTGWILILNKHHSSDTVLFYLAHHCYAMLLLKFKLNAITYLMFFLPLRDQTL